MKKAFIIRISLMLSILSTACNKDKQPKPSEKGENLVSYKLNGAVYKIEPEYKGGLLYNRDGYAFSLKTKGMYTSGDYFTKLTMDFSGVSGLFMYIKATDDPDYSVQTNVRYPMRNINDEYRSLYNLGHDDLYYADTTVSYMIFTRIDSIVAGRFEMIGYNSYGQSMKVTDGFFDIRL